MKKKNRRGNFRPVCKVKGKGKFEGIQALYEDGTIAKGGNVIRQMILWDIVEAEAQKKLDNVAIDFPKYDFKLVKC